MKHAPSPKTSPTKAGERLAKRMARAGLCSRRVAESWIAAGRVAVNGDVVLSPACDVIAADTILVDGKPIPEAEKTRLWLYHKPRGLVTTHSDPEARPTVFGALPPDMPRVISVGRLDADSEGLLLLTNDGGLSRALELPSTGWIRRYRIRVHGKPSAQDLAKLARGMVVDGMHYGQVEASLDEPKGKRDGKNFWLSVSLREGKNREIRVLFEHLGYPVNRLIRTAYGSFQLGALEKGELREVTGKVLREQCGHLMDSTALARFKQKRP